MYNNALELFNNRLSKFCFYVYRHLRNVQTIGDRAFNNNAALKAVIIGG